MNTQRIVRIIMFGIIIAMIFLTAMIVFQQPKVVNGSVAFGNDYQATTTDATWVTTSPKLLWSRNGSLGSVIIQTVGTGALTLYDATTTDNTLRASTATSTITLANWQITTSLGTYTFDVAFKNGLTAVWVGTNNATTTITYR